MQVVPEPSLYREDFAALAPRQEPEALSQIRRQAIDSFAELGFPSLHQEEWRSTNVAPIARTRLELPQARVQLDSDALGSLLYPDAAAMVFVNGQFSADYSQLDGLPEGVLVSSLAEALKGSGRLRQLAESELARQASFSAHAFSALNTAFFQDGALICLRSGTFLESPLQLLYVATGNTREDATSAYYPRTLIVAEDNSEATVIESYAGVNDGRYFTCAVTEIVCQANCSLRHHKVQKESLEAFHVAVQQVYLERDAHFHSCSISSGGALVRNDINAVLDGEGIDCTLNGLYLAGGRQHVDNHMRVEHCKPNCSSHELYKGILDGHAKGVFNGRIFVHPKAQKTDAKQTNRNLLLSSDALVNSNPQLEIFADDVRCTHGSTIGQLDPEALFYLRSRGLSESAARGVLTYAFAAELVEDIRLPALRRELNELLFARLPGGETVRQAV